AMDDDFTTPTAVAVIFDAVRDANAALDAGDRPRAEALAAAVLAMTGAVGLELRAADEQVDAEAAALGAQRDEARRGRDWARADALRDRLVALGWKVEDGPEGTRLSR
ncbi:MAG TPA: DALR domain-containing protein, partial [Acidimicrobiales bacterium]|nr:DALR domain-containing protein [Acidimicrobiales bacterium]